MSSDTASKLGTHGAKVPYEHLVEPESDLSEHIEQACTLGFMVVSDVPQLLGMRERLLSLAQCFAALPEEVRKQYEDSGSLYSCGWSHGREVFNGQPDMNKGSYYGNPLRDEPVGFEGQQARYLSLCGSNKWPREHLPDLEFAFKELGRLIIEVSLLVAAHLDIYLEKHRVADVSTAGAHKGDNNGATRGILRRTITESPNPKGRLLHYFPNSGDDDSTGDSGGWCGWHRDHGSLTGLTAGMYFKDGREVMPPDSQAGLYVKARDGSEVKAAVAGNELLFQFGEALQVQSGGVFCATPHYVRRPCASAAAEGVSRANFAVFTQPAFDAPMDLPPWAVAADIGVNGWQPGMSFGEFSEAVIGNNYN